MIFSNENNSVTNFFDIDFCASELKIFRQNNNLMSAISAEFGGVHKQFYNKYTTRWGHSTAVPCPYDTENRYI